ncbi:unnamed protein product [Durusdinium trenchii]|uniref:Flagellar attachment zone protein 1 n=4 Tax=Durusdinium trenchii TaxID=1381693 RepID=A0ABP0HLA4_9DINO
MKAPKALSPNGYGPNSRAVARDPAKSGQTSSQSSPGPRSIDEAITDLSKLQLMLAVPTVSELRMARPLRRSEGELYVAQFVLQSTHRKFNKFLSTPEGKCQLHPNLKLGSADGELGSDEGGSFGSLEDGTPVLYQTNGIARTEQPVLNRSIRCNRTGAPGHYMETKMLVARPRDTGLVGLARAKTIKTRVDLQANLFYSFTSCWQIYACSANVGQLGEEDSGERILVRRSVRDFQQHHFHDFPVAKHLADLLDRENEVLVKGHSFEVGEIEKDLFDYHCYTLRSWQTYECEGRPPESDVGRKLLEAARNGQVSEVKHLILNCGCHCDTIVSEFGCIGSGKSGIYTRTDCGFAEERTALIAAIQAGWRSVVETILEFVRVGQASLNVVCHEWNPRGIGGDCLRPCYTALDQAKLYHREDIIPLLEAAGALPHKRCKKSRRENPFDVRARQDRGEHREEQPKDSAGREDRYEDFTFSEWADEAQMDSDMKQAVESLKEELQQYGNLSEAEQTKLFRKLSARWHPDKHPDEKKVMATRVFQWIQHVKDEAWENRAWSA